MNISYETDNLILRVCSPKDASAVAAFYLKNYDDFGKYEPLFPQAKTAAFHRDSLEYELSMFKREQFLRLFLFEKQNPFTVIGTVSYREIKKSYYESCIVGYKIDAAKRRRGYAREALLLGEDIMFNELGLNRIEATVLPDNAPSITLLESLGFRYEGLLREKVRLGNTFADHCLYAKLKSYN